MVKQRNIAVCIILSILTCGLYLIYWFMCLTDDCNELAPEKKTASGGLAFLYTILTCGIYALYWGYKQGEKVDYIKGDGSGNSPLVFVLLQVFGLGIIAYCITQDAINKKCIQ